MSINYPAVFAPQKEGGYSVSFPDLPEAITEGDTFDEAMANAAEVLKLTLDGRQAEGMEIPAPSAAPETVGPFCLYSMVKAR